MRQAMRAWPFPALKKMAVACVPPSPSLFCCTTTPRPDSDKERMGEGRNPKGVALGRRTMRALNVRAASMPRQQPPPLLSFAP